MPLPLFTPGKDPVPIVQEAGWAPGPVWTDVENLALTRNRSPDRPVCSLLLYRLRYPAHITVLRYYCHLSSIWFIEHFGFSLQYVHVSGELRSFFHWCDENCYNKCVLIVPFHACDAVSCAQ
jgi:hypothetical protein